MRHVSSTVNAFGLPRLTYIDLELILDETHALYKAEEMFRIYGGALGSVDNMLEAVGVRFGI
jgi:hypothetical protein